MSELSELLKNRREELKKTPADISADTRIRIQFLEAIDRGDFKSLPSHLHAYGFVKQYAEYLGFSFDEIKDLFYKECPKDNDENNNNIQNNDMEVLNHKESSSGKSPILLLSLLILLCVGGWLVYKYVVNVDNVENNETLLSSTDINTSNNDTNINTNSDTNTNTTINNDTESNINIDSNLDLNSDTNIILDSNTQSLDNTQSNIELSQNNTLTNNQLNNTTNNINNIANATNLANNQQTDSNLSPELPFTTQEEVEKEEDVIKYINFYFSGDCWVLFKSDTGQTEDFVAENGTIKRLPFIKGFTIDIGNAANISMRYKSQHFSNFGRDGQARRNLKYTLTDDVLFRDRN